MEEVHTQDWVEHLHNTKKWACLINHSKPETFEKIETLHQHISDCHPEEFSQYGSKISSVTERSQIPILGKPQTCPICECHVDLLPMNVRNALGAGATSSLENNTDTTGNGMDRLVKAKKMAHHIAAHLKSLAFKSLTGITDAVDEVGRDEDSYKALNGQGNDNESELSTGSRSSIDDISLSSYDIPPDNREDFNSKETDEELGKLNKQEATRQQDRESKFPYDSTDAFNWESFREPASDNPDEVLEHFRMHQLPSNADWDSDQSSMVSSESSKRSSILLETTSERQNILNWLSHDDYRVQQSVNNNKRAHGTWEWLIYNAEFKEWLATRKQTLFCPEIPGVGKTIMTSGVIDRLYALFGNKANVGIAYIYFNFRRQHGRDVSDLLASLLRQLVQTQPSIPGVVRVLYEQHRPRGTRPSINDIFNALLSVAGTYSMVFIILDSLDDGGHNLFLSHMLHLQGECGANLFVTSRQAPDLTGRFEGIRCIEIKPSDRDIRIYLESCMSTLPPVVSHDAALQEEIVTAIEMAAQGSYVFSQCYGRPVDQLTATQASTCKASVGFINWEGYEDGYQECIETAPTRI
jgi:hypothetical protein